MKKTYLECLTIIVIVFNFNNLYAYTCPSDYKEHILVNQQYAIKKEYKSDKLVIPNIPFSFSGNSEKKYMDKEAAKALEEIFKAAKLEGIILKGVSAYRSYTRQTELYNAAISKYGEDQKGVAKPGHSEHQTGLTIDVSSSSVGYDVVQSFGDTIEGKWLATNCHKYGFIIRYPRGKESITKYMYEPWHIRYVGEELATYLHSNNLVLEEIDSCCQYDISNINVVVKNPKNKIFLRKTNMIRKDGYLYIGARELGEYLNIRVSYDKNSNLLIFQSSKEIKVVSSDLNFFIKEKGYTRLREVLKILGYNVMYTSNSVYIY